MNASTRSTPICGVLSVILTPLAFLFAFLATVLLETLFGGAAGWPDDSGQRRVARVIMLLCASGILAGVFLGVVALVRRERIRWLPLVGWLTTICALVVFDYGAGDN